VPDQTIPFDPFDDDDDEPGYCATCCNTGEVDCHCGEDPGGDIASCACGEPFKICPDCHGGNLDH